MQLKLPQLHASLRNNLAPVYLVSGDEPQQLCEATDAIRRAAKTRGYESREILLADKLFDWNALHFSSETFSIFADKKILDLRLTGSPGADGAKALCAYCQRLPEDNLLLITMGKLGKDAQKSAWFQAVDKTGCVIQVWPLTGHDLLTWMENRLQQRGLTVKPDALRLLASRVEGNLLAAAQEIEKLSGYYGTGTVTADQILEAVADNSRYDVFEWIEAILTAKVNKIVKILASLKSEGLAPAVVLWAISREIRLLAKAKAAIGKGGNHDTVFRNNGIWGSHKTAFELALKRLSSATTNQTLMLCAKTDRQIKGQQQGNPWATLLDTALILAGIEVIAKAG